MAGPLAASNVHLASGLTHPSYAARRAFVPVDDAGWQEDFGSDKIRVGANLVPRPGARSAR